MVDRASVARAADHALLYNAWRNAGAPAELHLYERRGHDFDLHAKGTTSDQWFDQFMTWLHMWGVMQQMGG